MFDVYSNELTRKFGYQISQFEMKASIDSPVVWDIENGILLELTGMNGKIKSATLGFEKLNQAQIMQYYGEDCIYKHLKWPTTNRQLENLNGAHWSLMGLFDRCKAPLISLVV